MDKINNGRKILTSWVTQYNKAKAHIEQDGVERWDFQPKPITERIIYMNDILGHMLTVAETLQKFLVFLGPSLKTVTGNTAGIDNLIIKVKNLVKNYIEPPRDGKGEVNYYNKHQSNYFKSTKSIFNLETEDIEKMTKNLINETFKDLRSSEGAFNVLQKFKNISVKINKF